ncbi:stage II sporulation protein M [Methanolapillus millepedarum]|uniref:Stage II sporulation protein M n=1 Tax=Methanolapillus millepedarum TaxID=3028296 RepID=A0AA96V342_9EURY|nr:hypothetical protein MsAc7_00470 [Methanosarcinaceae archaeon Ac7]
MERGNGPEYEHNTKNEQMSDSEPASTVLDPSWGDPVAVPSLGYKKNLFSFLSIHKVCTLWMAVIFIICFAVGYIVSASNPELSEQLMEMISGALGAADTENSFQLLLQIFFNNAQIALFAIAFGILLGLFPLFVIIANGLMVGVVSEYIIRTNGVVYLLIGIVPHGIIELPVIILSAGVGFRLGAVVFSKLIGRKVTWKMFNHEVSEAGWGFFYFILPLLLISAIIEVYVTGTLLNILFTV